MLAFWYLTSYGMDSLDVDVRVSTLFAIAVRKHSQEMAPDFNTFSKTFFLRK